MAYGKKFESKAILLKKIEYGETDNIVTFFTENRGKIIAFARHAKKSKKRFSSSLDVFACLKAQFNSSSKRNSLYMLESVCAFKILENIRKSLLKISMASVMCELYYEMTPEDVPSEKLFNFLCHYLENIDCGKISKQQLSLYLLNFLNLVGLGPNFSNCSICGKISENSKWYFSCQRGGLVCSSCLGLKSPSDTSLSLETLKIVRKKSESGDNFLKRIVPSKKAQNELYRIVKNFIQFNLGKRLNSIKFLEEIDEESYERV